MLLPLCFALATSVATPGPPASPGPRDPSPGLPGNILILVADDVGVDQLAAYGEGTDVPYTPALDALAADGLRFRNAWANPVCSPTRALVMTGRYAFRTGLGDILPLTSTDHLLPSEVTLPELLDAGAPNAWQHAAFGKWHLGSPTPGGFDGPNLAGFDHFAGTPGNLVQPFGYYSWPEVENGALRVSTEYATSRTVDSFLEWLPEANGPWLAYVAFNACHFPFEAPPPELHSVDLSGVPPHGVPRPYYKAVLEAMDTEIGRLLEGLGSERANTTILFLGDNGTPPGVGAPNFPPDQHKGTLYEGGINVPLIVQGPAVAAGSECSALVSAVDIFATVADLAGVDLASTIAAPLDSVSLLPYFSNPGLPSARDAVFAELFAPNGLCQPAAFERAVRDKRYKLITRSDAADELYDLELDPFETTDLLAASLSTGAAAAYAELRQVLADLLSAQPDAALEPLGCGTNPAGSLVLLGGAPAPGGILRLGVDNPLGTQPPGSLPLILVSLAPDPATPCGTPVPGWGMASPGAAGELLIDLAAALSTTFSGPAWTGPGSPTPAFVPIPFDCALIGVSVYLQGALRDPAAGAPIAIGLTEGLALTIGFDAP